MTSQLATKAPIRTNLAPTALLLAELAQRLDNGEPLTPIFQSVFAAAKQEHIAAVDHARTLATFLDGQVRAATSARDYWSACAKAAETALKELKAEALRSMEESPDLPWRDSYKQKLSLCNNSQPSLKTLYDDELGSKSVTNILDASHLDVIPERYQTAVSFIVLNTAAIREDLAAGKELPWAKLERGRHVRGLVMKKDADE